MSKRGRKPKLLDKSEIAEDYCFVCKDGGNLLICDYKQCLKSYHPRCVEKDENFADTEKRWLCGLHTCLICRKSSTFQCIGCTNAVCKRCIKSAEFVPVRGSKGFCANCLNLVLLIEQNLDVDADGGKIDFKDRNTYECLFKEYWEIINEKEGLTLEDLRAADILLKKGESLKSESDSDKFVEGEEEDQDFDETMDGKMVIEPDSSMAQDSKVFSPRKYIRKVKPKKMVFMGWGSKPLREFLKSIDKDSDSPISQNEVQEIIRKYYIENNLTHPEKKKKILCDRNLLILFGRKSVNRNKIYELLERHFAENLELSEEDESNYDSDEKEDCTTQTCKRQRRTNVSRITDEKAKVLETPQSLFASVRAENIKLVYLKRSLVEDFLKHPEVFEDKVMGSFVRIKTDPNDYFRKNAYQLSQVMGIIKAQGSDSIDEKVTLHVSISSMRKDVYTRMLSDEDFLEEEIEDLRQKVKDGLLQRLTIVDLERKARSLHEDLTKHWIKKELVRLQNLSDRANEKGWRRELGEYMEKIKLLRTPSEQQRLIQVVPTVMAEEIELEITSLDLRKDVYPVEVNSPRSILLPTDSATVNVIAGAEDAMHVCIKSVPDLSVIQVNGDVTEAIENHTSAHAYVEVAVQVNEEVTDKRTDENVAEGTEDAIGISELSISVVNGVDTDIKEVDNSVEGTGAASVVSKLDETAFDVTVPDFPENEDTTTVRSAMSNLIGDQHGVMDTVVDGLPAANEAEGRAAAIRVSEQNGSVSYLPTQTIIGRSIETQVVIVKQDEGCRRAVNKANSTPVLIDLDSDDEANADDVYQESNDEANADDEYPESKIWYYVDPEGHIQGTFCMLELRKWWESGYFFPDFKVWKEGQTQEEAILLKDALSRICPL